MQTKYYNETLKYVGRIAMIILILIYIKASSYGKLWTNPDWTISNVMVYDFNLKLTHYILFPCFLSICIVYSLKCKLLRIRIGSVVAICGGIGLILNPVTTKEMEHLICAFIVFLSSYFWYPVCTVFQLKTFCISTLFFFGGFALDIIFAVFHLNKITNEKNSSSIIMSSFLPFLPSIICMLGEFGIFITWGIMVQNEDVTKKKN